jgi:uncharacterized protein YihD (DUF1040 family)
MRDPDRIDEIVEQLRMTWKAAPDMRLGQLIINASESATVMMSDDTSEVRQFLRLWNLEDHLMSYGLGQLFASVASNAIANAETQQPAEGQ